MAASRQHRRQFGAQLGGFHTLDPENPDIPLLKARDEVCDGGLAEINRREVEHHRPASKKSRRARQSRVQFLEPAHYRHDRRKHEGDIRPPS